MDPLTLAIFGGGAALKTLSDQQTAQRDNLLTAAKIKYSPWTHYNVNNAPSPLDPGGNATRNLAAGAGGALQQTMLNKALTDGANVNVNLGAGSPGAAAVPAGPLGVDYSGLRNSYDTSSLLQYLR